MGEDKAAIAYHGEPQWRHMVALLEPLCQQVYLSGRAEQVAELDLSGPFLADRDPAMGPLSGLHAAFAAHPEAAWLVVACDLPNLTREALRPLIVARRSDRVAVCYRSPDDGLPEPLVAVYEPAMAERIEQAIAIGSNRLRTLLEGPAVHRLVPSDPEALRNVNTPREREALSGWRPERGR